MSRQPGESVADARIVDLLRSNSLESNGTGLRLILEKHGQLEKNWLMKKYGRDRLEMAQDAIHDAALGVAKNIDKYDRGRGPLDGWFLSIARNSFVTRLRAEKAGPLLSFCSNGYLEYLASQSTNPSSPTDRLKTALGKLGECIDKLSPMQQGIVLADLRRGGEADTEELARSWRTSPRTIHDARHRARARLATLMRRLRP